MSKADSGPKRTERESRVSAVGPIKVVAALFIGVAIGAGLMFVGVRQAGVDQSSEGAEDRILAVVDGSPITIDDLEAEMERRGGAAKFASRTGLSQLLDDMVRLETLAANARLSGYDSEHGVRQEMKHILAGHYRREHLEPLLANVAVTDQEVADSYASRSDHFMTPAAVHAALLYFAYPATASDQRRQEVADLAARVRDRALSLPEDAHFGALAVEHSDDQATRYLGGDIGWVAEGQKDSRWSVEVLDAIFALERPGSLSELITTPTGIYLVRLLDTKPATLRPLDEVAAAIKGQLRARKIRDATERFYSDAKGNVTVEMRRERIVAVEVPKASVADTERRPPPLPHS